MIFGLDEYGKLVQNSAAVCGRKAVVTSWLKLYKKVRNHLAVTITHYHQVKEDARRILAEAKELEQYLYEKENFSQEKKNRTLEIAADFTQTAPRLDYEFIISKADTEFHSTLESVAKLAGDFVAGGADPIILQSEVENLIYLTEEGLDKKKPDLFVLSCYYLDHSDLELQEMSYSMRLDYVDTQYQKTFIEPILPVMTEMMQEALACSPERAVTAKEKKKAQVLEELRKTAEQGLRQQEELRKTAEQGPGQQEEISRTPDLLARGFLKAITAV